MESTHAHSNGGEGKGVTGAYTEYHFRVHFLPIVTAYPKQDHEVFILLPGTPACIPQIFYIHYF